jgi:hypothetical protein
LLQLSARSRCCCRCRNSRFTNLNLRRFYWIENQTLNCGIIPVGISLNIRNELIKNIWMYASFTGVWLLSILIVDRTTHLILYRKTCTYKRN